MGRCAELLVTAYALLSLTLLGGVLGYYFEDQPVWTVGPLGDWASATRNRTEGAGKAAYAAWLRDRYAGDFRAFARIYRPPPAVAGWEAVIGYDFAGLARTPRVLADDGEFLGVVAERYFSIASAAVRKHDPGALVFGQRFLSNDAPPPVLRAAGRHFDVISVQPHIFSPTTAERVDAVMARLVGGGDAVAARPLACGVA